MFNFNTAVGALLSGKKVSGKRHGYRHRSSQVKAISRGRFSGKNARYGL